MPSSRLTNEMLAGGMAGISTRIITTPFDVVKIHAQLHQGQSGLRMHEICKDVVARHGMAGFFKGTLPGIGLYFVYSAVQFPVYHSCKRMLPDSDKSVFISLLAGSVGSTCATVISYPFDIVRTRSVHFGKSTLSDVVKTIMLEKKMGMGFFQGLLPALLSVAPRTAVSFSVYEEAIKKMDKKNYPILSSLGAGGIAGLIAKVVIYPLDTVGRRLQVHGKILGTESRLRLLLCVKNIFINEGIYGFFKGCVPTSIKSVISTACSFTVYEYAMRSLQIENDDDE